MWHIIVPVQCRSFSTEFSGSGIKQQNGDTGTLIDLHGENCVKSVQNRVDKGFVNGHMCYNMWSVRLSLLKKAAITKDALDSKWSKTCLCCHLDTPGFPKVPGTAVAPRASQVEQRDFVSHIAIKSVQERQCEVVGHG